MPFALLEELWDPPAVAAAAVEELETADPAKTELDVDAAGGPN